MKKKILTLITAFVCLLCLSLVLTACDSHEHSHEHRYADEWTSAGENGHYHRAICHPDEHSKIVPHTFDDDLDTTCNDCDYTRTTSVQVVFDANGGTFDKDGVLLEGEISDDGGKITLTTAVRALVSPTIAPERDRYAFSGWAKSRDAGAELWDFEHDELSGGITLYAVWATTFDFVESGDGTFYSVRGIGGLSGDVEIPETHNGKPVKEIADRAFKGESRLTGITIPVSVTKIGEEAFMRCNNLLYATLGEGISTVPAGCFAECGKLEKVTVPKSATKFEERSFGELGELTALTEVHYNGTADDWCEIEMEVFVVLNQGVSDPANPLSNENAKLYIDGEVVTDITVNAPNINDYAFYHYRVIKSVTVGNSVETIGRKAFTQSGVEKLTFSDESAIKTIGEEAFSYSKIKSVALPQSTVSVQTSAFSNCLSLNSVDLGGTKYVYDDSFRGCDDLINLNLSSAEELGETAFGSCKSLANVTIPDTVWTIGSGAFSLCNKLASVTFASNENNASWLVSTVQKTETVTSAQLTNAAQNANRIKESGTWMRIYAGNGNLKFDSDIYDYSYKVTGYDNNLHGKGVIIIPSTYNGKPVTSIEHSAFSNCGSLTSITIPDSVTYIGGYAFSGCSNLTSITIPDSVTYIGSNAFYGCNNLRYNEYDNAYYLGNDTNKYVALIKAKDTSIASCTIHENAKVIRYHAFSGCSNLTSITIPNSVTYIGGYAFSGCSNLTSITVESGNTKYHSNGNCLIETTNKKLIAGCKSSVIPTDGSVTSIGSGAFSYCDGLTSITIPNSVTFIENYAFSDCSSLTIYCEAASKPSGWSFLWNSSNRPVVWDCKNK